MIRYHTKQAYFVAIYNFFELHYVKWCAWTFYTQLWSDSDNTSNIIHICTQKHDGVTTLQLNGYTLLFLAVW